MGITGVGKTLFLKELSKQYQVIDFEGLAKHKGSILGNIPNQVQPTQKYFETLIYEFFIKSEYESSFINRKYKR